MSASTVSGPVGVHLVGSAPLPTTEAAFRYFCDKCPGHLHRMPDGEPGERRDFVRWQGSMISQELEWPFGMPAEAVPADIVQAKVAALPRIRTGYEDAAISSYAVFRKLKQEGIIPANTRFQVSLPTVIDAIYVVHFSYRAAVEPVYEEALLRTLASIQEAIPADQLAIQWDLAIEFGILEGVPFLKPWFEPTLDSILTRLKRLVDKVHQDVDMGFHLCYGDAGHQHFIEPKDMGILVTVASGIFEMVGRPVKWIHMPVPKNRDDVAYFTPLKGLVLPEQTELYLGLVHADDEDGTIRRIRAANEAGIGKFGVGTECGLGRTPVEELDSIFGIFNKISAPYSK